VSTFFYEDNGNEKTANSSNSTTPLSFENDPARKACEYLLLMIYIAETRVINLHFCRW